MTQKTAYNSYKRSYAKVNKTRNIAKLKAIKERDKQ